MKLKYYLRGLGIGIIVTAVIMGVASESRKETLSDREIKERAAELGMVEQGGSLADLEEMTSAEPAGTSSPGPVSTPSAEPSEPQTSEPSASPEEEAVAPTKTPVAEPAGTPSPKPTKTPVAEPTAVPAAEPSASPEAEAAASTQTPVNTSDTASKEAVTIEIKSGEGSYAVCQKLEQAGLIASASDFDAYLYTNGYDRKLRIGSYEIPAGAEPETIAAILTRTQ